MPSDHHTEQEATSRPHGRLGELARLFLRLGTTAFGGPAAHLAMMEDEVVRRRAWMSSQEFLDLIAVTNLIPGPNSSEMAIHIGYRRAGWRGLLIAGTCFTFPAFVIVFGLAWLYVRYHTLPVASGMLRGVQPVIIAIIVQALWRLGRTAIKTRTLAVLALASVGLGLAGVHELIVLFAAAFAMVATHAIRARTRTHAGGGGTLRSIAPLLVGSGTVSSLLGSGTAPVGLGLLFLFFLKVGSVLYGSGYVLIAFLRADLVERWGWLTESQLLDAIAVGQVTPGPLFTTATFIGFLLAGPWGAVVSTGGMFLPAFVFVAASAPLVPRLRKSALASAVLDGLNVGSLALMVAVTFFLARSTLVDVTTWALAAGSLVLLLWLRLNSTWLVAAGFVLGVLFFQ
ncbi:MAG: chromate efflux transporter [Phycisphaerae bacterium]|nr:chromate efflux transporter [Phycisphaerae bacterium]